jgi:hypothetical protein
VGTCQGATGAETGTVKQSSAGQCKEAEAVGADKKASEMGDLVLEGEEQEYFLELLMRRVSPERPQKGQAASNKNGSKEKVAVTEGKEKKRSKKKERKALKKGEAGRRARGQERAESPACNRKEQAALDLLNNLEDWVLTSMERRRK